jgi:hypothetical protein
VEHPFDPPLDIERAFGHCVERPFDLGDGGGSVAFTVTPLLEDDPMAAVIEFRTGSAIQEHPRPQAPRRPQLSVIHGGRSPEVLRRRRTYLRRRLVAGLAVLAVAVCLVAATSSVLSGAGVAASTDTAVHTVRPGDTLWEVAVTAAPQADPRDVIDRIVELNSTGGAPFSPDAPLRVGQVLTVPGTAD